MNSKEFFDNLISREKKNITDFEKKIEKCNKRIKQWHILFPISIFFLLSSIINICFWFCRLENLFFIPEFISPLYLLIFSCFLVILNIHKILDAKEDGMYNDSTGKEKESATVEIFIDDLLYYQNMLKNITREKNKNLILLSGSLFCMFVSILLELCIFFDMIIFDIHKLTFQVKNFDLPYITSFIGFAIIIFIFLTDIINRLKINTMYDEIIDLSQTGLKESEE